ncbi:hypothetical protein HYX58_04075 [Candidatus Dependentiae bacterium]|nr:hypothetical protein [Candidatus Dependentiae bacterium]
MHLVKIKLTPYYHIAYATSEPLKLLGFFLEDFGSEIGIEILRSIVIDKLQDCTSGNKTSLYTLKNGNLCITILFPDKKDPVRLEITPETLLQVTKLYLEAEKKRPAEIIIKLDHSMENPTIETILYCPLNKA